MPNSGTDFQKKPRDKVIIFRPAYLKVVLDLFKILFLWVFFFFKCLIYVFHIFYYSAQDSLNLSGI